MNLFAPIFALAAAGLCAARMAGHWRRTVPTLVLVGCLLGALAHVRQPANEALGGWCVLASAVMVGLLILLPRPHSAPSAVVAAGLLGFGVGTQLQTHGGSFAQTPFAWATALALALAVYSIGDGAGKLVERATKAERRFAWIGGGACLVSGLLMAARLA